MSIEIVFETHALSEDNERGIATGWLPGRRVMLIGHLATYRGLEHAINGRTVRESVEADFEWRPEGWEYRLDGRGTT